MAEVRNALAEAQEALGGSVRGVVLEPSPPAIDDGEWFADDPVNADVAGDGPLVTPAGNGDESWVDRIAADPSLAAWASERSLAAHHRLEAPPATLVETRLALHRLATYVIAPARHQFTGKFGLRWVRGGFGTPFFGADRQVRVEGSELVVQEADGVRAAPITSLRAAAELIGSDIDGEVAAEHDSPPLGDVDEVLPIDPVAVSYLDGWWGLATYTLERLRADRASVAPSRVQLWPGHFDPAVEIGDDDRRASYGASPGDATNAEPYLYVAPWSPDQAGPDKAGIDADDGYWNAASYTGAVLPLARMLEAPDQAVAAIEFFRDGRELLTGPTRT